MDEFVKKLIERLEEEHERCINRYGIVGGNAPAMEVKRCMEIVNELAEECKEECNLQSDKILFAYSDLLRRFRQAEESCIWELSGSIENDIKELEEECEQLLDGFNALLYSSDKYDNGWIPCSERLPKKKTWVLVTRKSGVVDIEKLSAKGWICKIDEVIAWMPLPAPYKPSTEQPDSISEAWK